MRADEGASAEWPVAGGEPGGSQYSRLEQVHTGNVHKLQQAWVYQTGDAREDDRSQIQCNPIVIEGVLYATSPQLKAFALDAATGVELWTFDPFAERARESSLGVNRGVVYWSEGSDERIFLTAGEFLHALNAKTGRLIPSFGDDGRVSLREGLDRNTEKLHVLSNSPGAIYRDLLILGTRVSEGPGPSAPGHIRAYDVQTGEIRWIFHTIPHPGEYGYETWPPEAWKQIGGANAWSGLSVDRERGWVFLPTGSPAFDFWGGNRKGKNLFGNCLLVLEAASGRRIWHYQFVHHDLWDRDLPAAPNLVRVRRGEEMIDAVAQVTKSGHVFVFDRETGDPVYPIVEQPVPTSDLLGEEAWPTQPLPLEPPPFSRQSFTKDLVTDMDPEVRTRVLQKLESLRTGRQFIPPSIAGTVIFPGFDGGAEWGGAAYDPSSDILYVNANEMPWILTMVPIAGNETEQTSFPGRKVYNLNCAACHGINLEGDPQRTFPKLADVAARLSRNEASGILQNGKGVMPSFGFLSQAEKTAVLDFLYENSREPAQKKEKDSSIPLDTGIPYTHTGYNRFLDEQGYPVVKPPWGTLNAIDLNRASIQWQVPLGEFPELTARGVPPTGTENYGGPIVTAGGLLFIGASKDEMFRAFDKSTGKILWETKLPAGGYATPATYSVDGRQYIVIAAGGGKMGTSSGDAYVAFALPYENLR